MHGDGAARPTLAGFTEDLSSEVFRKADPVRSNSLSDELCQLLHELGVRHAFGLTGGANAAFVHALGQSRLNVTQFRHESGAGFAATELSLATGEPVLLFATTGPGLLNVLNGVSAARWEGARVVLVSGCTSASRRGRWASQETSNFTLPSELFVPGTLFDYATVVEDPAQLEVIATRLAVGLRRPNGFVAHVALSMNVQAMPAQRVARKRVELEAPGVDDELAKRCAKLLANSRFGIWVGYGARNASQKVRALAEMSGAPVISTPRAKGIFPESDPRYLGVSGVGGTDDLVARFKAADLTRMLVLGTRLGESSTFWNAELQPPMGFVHVDLDPSVPGAAYPSAETLGVVSEIGQFLDGLIRHWPNPDAVPPAARGLLASFSLPPPAPPERWSPRTGPIRSEYLMQRIQEVVVERSRAVVMADAGNAFAWATHCLAFDDPGRFRVSTGYGSMGHFSAGVIGSALALDTKAVAVVGDGALLMNNELSTAAVLDVPAVWIVLNDARLGMVEQGMRGLGMQPVACEFPQVDFVAIARAVGCDGVRVQAEDEVDRALEVALSARGPFVVDVLVDPGEPSPVTRRVESLMRQIRANVSKEGA